MSAANPQTPQRSWRKIGRAKFGIRAREEKPGPWKPRARATARTERVPLYLEILGEIEGRTMAHGKMNYEKAPLVRSQ